MGDLNKPGLVRSGKTHECTSVRREKLVRWSVSAIVLAAGIMAFVVGIHLETSTSRPNMEDILVWSVLAIGAVGIGTGFSLPFARPSGVVLIGLASPFIAYGTAVLVVWAWIVVVEVPQGWRYCRTLDAARSQAPYVADFVRLFPEAEVRYRYFAPGPEPGYDLHVVLYERYEFGMQLPVTFNRWRTAVAGYGEPRFYLWEVSSVEGRGISYNSTRGREFGSAEWRRIVANDGDFTAIGYTMVKDHPVAGLTHLLTRK